MKTLTRMIIVFITLNLITAGFALAQINAEPVPPTAVPAPTPSTIITRNQRDIDRLVRSVTLSTGRSSVGTGTGNTVLVIPNQEIKAEELLTINEDINVMSRIFDNELNQERISKSNMSWSFTGNDLLLGDTPMLFNRDRDKTGTMYLQGYGALFLMNVDFPLSAPPDMQEQEEEETEEEDVDQVWEQTRQQIYEPQSQYQTRRLTRTTRPEVKYDAEKVESLKTSLIKALKHAANIRILKPDESLILSITGSGISDRIVSMQELPGTDDIIVIEENQGEHIQKIYTGGLPEDLKFSSPTVLVIRAKKTDIDSFAKGDVDLNQFRQRVQILSYPLLGGNVAGTSTSPTLPTVLSTGTR